MEAWKHTPNESTNMENPNQNPNSISLIVQNGYAQKDNRLKCWQKSGSKGAIKYTDGCNVHTGIELCWKQ